MKKTILLWIMTMIIVCTGAAAVQLSSSVMHIDIYVYENDSVSINNISQRTGSPSSFLSGGSYQLVGVGADEQLFNYSFPLRFEYYGSVELGVDYTNLSHHRQRVIKNLAYSDDLQTIHLYKDNAIIWTYDVVRQADEPAIEQESYPWISVTIIIMLLIFLIYLLLRGK